MNKKRFITFLLIILCLLFSSCSRGFTEKSNDAPVPNNNSGSNNVSDSGTDVMKNVNTNLENRKLIKDVNMTVETKDFDKLMTNLNMEIQNNKGYIQESNVSGNRYNSSSNRYATIIVRVPADKLDGFTGKISSLCNIVSKTESTRDVTMDYIDVESHVNALRTEQQSLQNLMSKTQNLNDILQIQKTLTEIIYQIESYESKLRTYDNLIAYSTITMRIEEVEKITPVGNKSAWQQIGSNFSNNIGYIGKGASAIFVWLVSSSPFLLIITAIVWVIIVLIRRSEKKRRLTFQQIYNTGSNKDKKGE